MITSPAAREKMSFSNQEQRTACRPEPGRRDGAQDDARAELDRHRPALRRRRLISDELDECQERQDPRSPGVTEEGEPAVVEAKPAEIRRPADRRRRRESTQAGYNPDEQRKQVESHRIALAAGPIPHADRSGPIPGTASRSRAFLTTVIDRLTPLQSCGVPLKRSPRRWPFERQAARTCGAGERSLAATASGRPRRPPATRPV